MSTARLSLLSLGLAMAVAAEAQTPSKPSGPFDRLRFREIGPASMGGRIDDFAVLESNPAVFYVATATGGVWKAVNNGTTFETVFDRESTDELDKELAKVKPQLGVGQAGFDPGAFQRNVRQRIGGLKGSVMGSTSRPTEVQLRQTGESRAALVGLVVEVNAAIARAQGPYRDLAAANLLMEVPKPLAAPTASPSGGR